MSQKHFYPGRNFLELKAILQCTFFRGTAGREGEEYISDEANMKQSNILRTKIIFQLSILILHSRHTLLGPAIVWMSAWLMDINGARGLRH